MFPPRRANCGPPPSWIPFRPGVQRCQFHSNSTSFSLLPASISTLSPANGAVIRNDVMSRFLIQFFVVVGHLAWLFQQLLMLLCWPNCLGFFLGLDRCTFLCVCFLLMNRRNGWMAVWRKGSHVITAVRPDWMTPVFWPNERIPGGNPIFASVSLSLLAASHPRCQAKPQSR